MKMMVVTVVTVLAMLMAGAVPAFAKAAEIAVTGVVTEEQDKADGTPVYGIKDESTLGKEWYQKKGYLLKGDYSAYLGQRVTVYGIPEIDAGHRVLDVSRIEK
jgi:hypothetical protein